MTERYTPEWDEKDVEDAEAEEWVRYMANLPYDEAHALLVDGGWFQADNTVRDALKESSND